MNISNNSKITTTIKTDGLIELIDFTEAFLSIGLQYKKCIQEHPPHVLSDISDDYRLYIKEIRSGSIVTELVPYAAITMPFIVDFNNLAFFSSYLKNAFQFFIGKNRKDPKIDKKDCEHLNKILTPSAKDRGGLFNFNLTINGDIKDSFKINHSESNDAQKAICEYKEGLQKERHTMQYNGVVLNLKQARSEAGSRVGDIGIIEKISKKMVKLFYDSDDIKVQILLDTTENPFHYLYIVDVEADTIDGNIVLYKILKFHEKFKKPQGIE